MANINFLPPWVETNEQPAFYDKESGTVLQQTARMYAKVNQLVRSVNEQNETIADYIQQFIDLKDYCEDYFENLDVQQEVNNKLEEMAEDGTLQEIIATYIQANVAWTFDTVADMKTATNLVAGSYAQTLGFYAINDGGGATYYITDAGTANEMDVIAIGSLFANLVAEKVINPLMFGAVGNGTTDDSLNIQECINYGKANNITVIDGLNKNYIVSDAVIVPDTISSVDELGIYIDYGVTLRNIKLKLKDGCQSLTSVLNIANPTETNVLLENITINGNKSNQTTAIATQDGGLHGIRVGFPNHSAGGFNIINSYIYDCYTDDIDIRALDFDSVEISGCKIKGAGRNGITDNSKNSLIDHCTFLDNGSRTDPKSAYHVEPDSAFDFGIKTLSNCKISNTTKAGIAFYFNSNTFNLDTLNVINCESDSINITGISTNNSFVNKINLVNSTFNGLHSGFEKGSGGKVEYKEVNISGCRFNNSLYIAGSEYTTKTHVNISSTYFAKEIQLRNGFGDIVIDGCSFIKDEMPSSTGVDTLAIALSYITTQATYTADSLTVVNCYAKNCTKFIYNKAGGTTRVPKNITNVNISNNTYVSDNNTFMENEGSLTNIILKGNLVTMGGTGYKRFVVGTCANLIATNNICSFGYNSDGFNTTNVTTGLITNNIFNGTIQTAS